MTYKIETVKQEGVTLSGMIWMLLRRQPHGYIAKVLEANPGIADAGAHLPVGTKVKFPLEDVPVPMVSEKGVRLWD